MTIIPFRAMDGNIRLRKNKNEGFNEQKQGHIYRHFKGNLYTLLNVGRCREENEFYAIYRRTDHESKTKFGWCRHSETEAVYYVYAHGDIETVSVAAKFEDEREGIQTASEHSGLWIRPLEMFFGYKEVDGRMVRRFKRT